jgi:hypothetical protein
MTLKSRNDLSEDMEKAKGNGVRNGGFGIKKNSGRGVRLIWFYTAACTH